MAATGALRWIFRLSQVSAIFPFTLGSGALQESKILLVYTKLMAIFLGLEGIYFSYLQLTESSSLAPNGSSQLVLVFSNFSIELTGFMVFHATWKQRRALLKWLNKIPEVFSHLKEDKIRKVAAIYYRIFVVTVVFLVFTTVSDMYLYDAFYKDLGIFYFSFVVLFLSYITIMLETKMFIQLFLVFVCLIRYHYAETRDYLRTFGKASKPRFWVKYLRDFRSRDLEVKDLVVFLHSYFIPVVSMQISWTFFVFLYNLSMSIKFYSVVQVLWDVYIIWDIVLIAAECQMAENEGERTVHCLHEFFIQWDDRELRKEIDIISLQLQHRKLEFIVFGCQRLNFSLVYWLAGLLASYAVVMAQFHINPNPSLGSALMGNVSERVGEH